MALDVASVADTVTKTVIASLTLIVVIFLVLGLARAWAGRRRAQVVLEDIEPLEGHPVSLVAGLSPQLRKAVRRALTNQSRDAAYSHLATLAKDLETGLLVAARGTTVSAARTERQATTHDSLIALSAGVRALAPKEADGFLAVLGASLPVQRGCIVHSFPALRGAGAHTEVGITHEFAEFGHAPVAVTTFWSSTLATAGTDAELSATARNALGELLELAALWIAIRLVARQLTPTVRLDARRLDIRPHLTQAEVHERVARSHRRAGSPGPARLAFIEAVRAYTRADELLSARDLPLAVDSVEDTRARIQVRRTKCRLLSEDIAQSVLADRDLQTLAMPRQATSRTLYNTACLLAVALAVEDKDDHSSLRERSAWHLLGRSLLIGGDESPWEFVVTDVDLENLNPELRFQFCEELKTRSAGLAKMADAEAIAFVDKAMAALDLVPPPREAPTPEATPVQESARSGWRRHGCNPLARRRAAPASNGAGSPTGD